MAAEEVESRPEAAASKPKGRGLSIVMVAILMSVEGAGVFFATKMFAGGEPSSATAAEAEAESGAPPHADGHGVKSEHGGASPIGAGGAQAEVELTECRPSN